MSGKRTLRVVGWCVVIIVVAIVAAYVYAVGGELVVWAVAALWQLPSVGQKVVLVAVVVIVGTVVGIRQGARSSREYGLKKLHRDNSPGSGCDDPE